MSVNEQKIQIMHEILTRLNYYSKIQERITVYRDFSLFFTY